MTMTWQEQPEAWERTMAECEAVIERGQQTFVEVGLALLEIRDRRLYREGWRTFEDYCQERWGWGRRYANRLIEATQVVETLGPIGPKPTTETQVRELVPLLKTEPEAIPEVWAEVNGQAEAERRAVTAKDVQQAVQERKQKSHAQAHAERLAAYQAAPAPVLPTTTATDTVVQADALSYLQSFPDAVADLCVTSPPYWAKREYTGDERELGREKDPNEYVKNLVEIVNEIGRVLKPHAYLFLNLGDTYGSQPGQYRGQPERTGISKTAIQANASALPDRQLDVPEKSLVGIPWRVLLALILQDAPWRCANVIAWIKDGAGPENVYDRLTQRWEPILVLTKNQHAYLDREKLKDAGTGDVWQFPVGRRGDADGHYAPFPEDLVLRAITAACPEGGTVLDPFAGSGTTLKVANALGRRFLGCDLLPPANGGVH